MRSVLTALAALLGFVSAALWAFASFQTVAPDDGVHDAAGLQPLRIIETEGRRATDILATAKRQTFWNGWAAGAAAAAAAAQALSLLFD